MCQCQHIRSSDQFNYIASYNQNIIKITIVQSAHHHIITSSHQHISTSTHQHINTSSHQIESLSHCTLCPRNCGANRFSGKLGVCKSDALFRVSSVFAHKGEESVISGAKGICNIFFPHCNLQCVYCQNYDISRNVISNLPEPMTCDVLIDKICSVLDHSENIVGFVSPSHYIPQMLAIIRGIKETGRNPIFVYNSNGYDKVETLKSLEGIVDVYLPDFKYMDANVASDYSQAGDYPKVASAAIKEMYRQKGSTLIINEKGIAEWGIIIRHLVLPNAISQSIEVLKYIAEEISPNLHISLMSQYYPTTKVKDHPHLNRPILAEEYRQVLDAMYELGFHRGWTQELESHASYRPDFSNDQPFR
jgi:putative pyruvate formate lyase activating enzyme